MTDEKDSRTLAALLENFYGPAVIATEAQRLSASGVYFVPRDGALSTYAAYVKGLPLMVRARGS